MDIKQLIEKMEEFAGEKVGQKPGDQWKGTDKGTPGKKLVGDSILKDLSKGKKAKSREQELSEEFQAFLEAEFQDTVDKRPARKNARHSRGHEPQPRYKTVKADEGLENPHPASKDPIVAKVVKQMRPGLTGIDMNNEAFLYFAYEIGKMRAREMWKDYGPAIKYFYQSGIGVNEGWESGPEEYKEPYDDADDAYERRRQEKIDTEAEKEWAKLPKVSTYKLIGRGPNMEPNYEFGDEFDSMEQALEYRAKIMKDPKTPHPEHIGIRTLTRVKDQTNEAVMGGGGIKDYNDYIEKLDRIHAALQNAKEKDNWPWWTQRLHDLNRIAKAQGLPVKESRGHNIIATKLKNLERERKFASGELKIPTPQERQAQLKKLEKVKPVKEYGADTVSPYGQPTAPKVDPKQAQQVAANLNTQKTALNQLKQINPEIDSQKAATAMTKDPATMTPQEKEELAQVAKTLSPALGTPAFGSIKTAIQKSQVK